MERVEPCAARQGEEADAAAAMPGVEAAPAPPV
jgi:hypothetical protein